MIRTLDGAIRLHQLWIGQAHLLSSLQPQKSLLGRGVVYDPVGGVQMSDLDTVRGQLLGKSLEVGACGE